MASFVCQIDSCKGSSDLSITCFGLCQRNFHLKCIGIPDCCTRLYTDPSHGFRFICVHCRTLSCDSISLEFKTFEKSLEALKSKILGRTRALPALSNASGSSLDSSPFLGSSRKRSSKSLGGESSFAQVAKRSMVDQPIPVDNDVVATVQTPPPPVPANITTTSSSSGAAPTTVSLTVVPKPACLFVSRLDPSTTIEQVKTYIQQKLGDNSVSSVRKLTKDTGNVASFQLFVPINLQETLLQKSFWPDSAFIKNFENKSRNSRRSSKRRLDSLPANPSNPIPSSGSPKN